MRRSNSRRTNPTDPAVQSDTAQKAVNCSASQIAKNILRYRRRFVGLARQVDDTSIVVVKVGEPDKHGTCRECLALEQELP